MKSSTILCFLLFLAGITMGLLQLWFRIWSNETFFKIIVTDGAFFAISFVWAFLVKESRASEKIKGGNSLD
jgi:hypothetical protein